MIFWYDKNFDHITDEILIKLMKSNIKIMTEIIDWVKIFYHNIIFNLKLKRNFFIKWFTDRNYYK